MTLIYVVVPVDSFYVLDLVRAAVCRPWLEAYNGQVMYWVETLEEAEAERSVLALAGFPSGIELLSPEA